MDELTRRRLILLTRYDECLRHQKRARGEEDRARQRGDRVLSELYQVELAIQHVERQAVRAAAVKKACQIRAEKLRIKAEEMHPNGCCDDPIVPGPYFTDHELEFAEYHASIDVLPEPTT